MKKDVIIFDLGNVLIDWNPIYLFNKLIEDDEKRKYFLENICTPDWNEEQDAGRPIKEATETLVAEHPEWKELIEAYYGQWEQMLGGAIHDTVDIFRDLKQMNKYKFYALTNWSAELFPIALERYDFLHWFDGRVVSGEEKMRKPFPEFYNILLKRYDINPSQSILIDDNFRNIEGGEAVGIEGIHFTSPAALRETLEKRQLL
jgi:2-haloacid dehalogenase